MASPTRWTWVWANSKRQWKTETCPELAKSQIWLSDWKPNNIYTDVFTSCVYCLLSYFANKGPSSKTYGFSSSHVWMWQLDYKESWVPKNWYFEQWCWRRLLRAPWTAKRSNQSILKEISPECSLEGLMLKPNFQYFGHLMWRADSFEKTLKLGKIEGRRRRGWQRMRWLDGITDSMDLSFS